MIDKNKITIPKPPSILLKAGKDKYYSIAEMLIGEGKWKAGDEIALLALCMNYQRWIQAEKEIKKFNELTFKTDSGYRQQIPEISIANNAMANMLNYIREFALTPRERSKLKEYVLQNTDDPEMLSMIII